MLRSGEMRACGQKRLLMPLPINVLSDPRTCRMEQMRIGHSLSKQCCDVGWHSARGGQYISRGKFPDRHSASSGRYAFTFMRGMMAPMDEMFYGAFRSRPCRPNLTCTYLHQPRGLRPVAFIPAQFFARNGVSNTTPREGLSQGMRIFP